MAGTSQQMHVQSGCVAGDTETVSLKAAANWFGVLDASETTRNSHNFLFGNKQKCAWPAVPRQLCLIIALTSTYTAGPEPEQYTSRFRIV